MIVGKVMVTGGAGFIGSYLVDRLVEEGKDVVVYDDLSSGKKEFIEEQIKSEKIEFVLGDMLNIEKLNESMMGVSEVWHLAANPDVRSGSSDTKVHLEQNIIATHNLLETMRKNGVRSIFFTSTSTVYGEASVIPTSEDYGPLKPISLYGASKLAAEALISSYCYTFDMETVFYRFANVIGKRSTHGVIYDFVNKLRKNPKELEILGDGNQCKSYFLINDCIDGMLFGAERREERVEIYNIGSEDMITVKELAKIVVDGMGLQDVKFTYTGGVDGGRGWKGDVKVMQLSIEKLKNIGWMPEYNSSEAVEKTALELV
ncbi:MAG: NAD-dependent epimerase/dehydratase family protein [Halobacteriota archaeon]|nr:NAD-dependent epimerase/dehydratase family protein [Halobacteriota archaeon]